jgi:hypothetical protein
MSRPRRVPSTRSRSTASCWSSGLRTSAAEAQAQEAAEALTEKDALAQAKAKANEVSARKARKALEKQLKADKKKSQKA